MNAEFDFEKLSGLLPAVVQDSSDGEVLMVGFMNHEALERTLREKYVTFFSRTRQKLWMKGETSGNRLRLVSAHTDCDCDTVLLRVEVEGNGVVCHRGTRSCFTEAISQSSPQATTNVLKESR
jgi:phosphoribosyl-AMP cyclohydrolase